jgi:urea transport system ATP-binding protein
MNGERERAGAAVLSARGIAALRGGKMILANVSLDLFPGDRIHLAGENGSGKTTLLETLLGLRPSSAGSVAWMGRRTTPRHDRAFVAGTLFFLPQHRNLFPSLTLRENIFLGAALSNAQCRTIVDEASSALPELATALDQMPASASGGQRQLAAALRLLAHTPTVAVLDEPTAGLSGTVAPVLLSLLLSKLSPTAALLVTDQHTALFTSIATRRLRLVPPADAIGDDEKNAFRLTEEHPDTSLACQ